MKMIGILLAESKNGLKRYLDPWIPGLQKNSPEKDPLRSNGGGDTNIFPSFSETNFVIAGITLSDLMHLTIIIFCIKVSFSSHSPGKGISYGLDWF